MATADEDPAARKRRARRIVTVLGETYPDARCELDFTTPLELLVATILSAQCTDQRVNSVTPALFRRYPDAAALAGGRPGRARGAHRAHRVLPAEGQDPPGAGPGAVRRVRRPGAGAARGPRDAAGRGPQDRERRARRRLRRPRDHRRHPPRPARAPVRVDRARPTPRRSRPSSWRCSRSKDWTLMSHRVIWHGRRRCHARRPACGACPVARWCPAFGEGPTDPVEAGRLVRDSGRG